AEVGAREGREWGERKCERGSRARTPTSALAQHKSRERQQKKGRETRGWEAPPVPIVLAQRTHTGVVLFCLLSGCITASVPSPHVSSKSHIRVVAYVGTWCNLVERFGV
ncbi:hypothetical protein KC19_4G239000, partial [Ceratodon purpureus]